MSTQSDAVSLAAKNLHDALRLMKAALVEADASLVETEEIHQLGRRWMELLAGGASSKKYLVFLGKNYYASGGWMDFAGAVDTLQQAKGVILKAKSLTPSSEWGCEWWQIVDGQTLEIVDFEGEAQT